MNTVRKDLDGVRVTEMEEAFINHPDALSNPRKAYLETGFDPALVNKNAYRLRKRFHDQIITRVRDRLDDVGITDGRLLTELGTLALYNVIDAFETIEIDVKGDDGVITKRKISVLRDIKELPVELQRAVKKVEFDSVISTTGIYSYVSKIEFHDKLGALRDFLRVRGIYEPAPGGKPPPTENNPLSQLTVQELEQIAEIHEHARERLERRASSMRDSRAIEGKVVSKK